MGIKEQLLAFNISAWKFTSFDLLAVSLAIFGFGSFDFLESSFDLFLALLRLALESVGREVLLLKEFFHFFAVWIVLCLLLTLDVTNVALRIGYQLFKAIICAWLFVVFLPRIAELLDCESWGRDSTAENHDGSNTEQNLLHSYITPRTER
jgi:hypothetical protein